MGAVGPAPPRASEGVGAAGEGGAGSVGGTTSLHDHHKSQFDSHNDSGFLSGSNLLSSSSLTHEDIENMPLAEAPPPQDTTKGGALSPTRLDSGIDISDQLSSLHLASTSTSTTSTSTSELGEGEDTSSPVPPRPAVTPPPRRSRLGLSEAQVALLQEIFKRDEDGDT